MIVFIKPAILLRKLKLMLLFESLSFWMSLDLNILSMIIERYMSAFKILAFPLQVCTCKRGLPLSRVGLFCGARDFVQVHEKWIMKPFVKKQFMDMITVLWFTTQVLLVEEWKSYFKGLEIIHVSFVKILEMYDGRVSLLIPVKGKDKERISWSWCGTFKLSLHHYQSVGSASLCQCYR